MKTFVDIYSGFLGAGKTTLIKKFLLEKAYDKNTVIIENEFGDVSIDGEILKESAIEVKEINSGCICCQVVGKFDRAILEILNKYKPSEIIIEPSGVAKLSEVLNILTSIKFSHLIEVRNIFTIVDVLNYDMYIDNFKEFYVNQIKNADTIIFSRLEECSTDKADKIFKSVKNYNDKALLIKQPLKKLTFKQCSRSRKTENTNHKKSSLLRGASDFINKKSSAAEFENYPIYVNGYMNEKELENKFNKIAESSDYGKIVRAKGIIQNKNGQYFQFDYVPSSFTIREIKWSNKKVISFIGEMLNKTKLDKLFKLR